MLSFGLALKPAFSPVKYSLIPTGNIHSDFKPRVNVSMTNSSYNNSLVLQHHVISAEPLAQLSISAVFNLWDIANVDKLQSVDQPAINDQPSVNQSLTISCMLMTSYLVIYMAMCKNDTL